jgi:hypothetical protein
MSPIIPLRGRASSMPHRPRRVLQLGYSCQRGGDERRPHRVGRHAMSHRALNTPNQRGCSSHARKRLIEP